MNELERTQARYEERDRSQALSGFWTLANPVVVHLMQERERAVLRGLHRSGLNLAQARVLDVGCGTGQEFASLLRWGARREALHGVEVSPHRAEAARSLGLGAVTLLDGHELPHADASFDLVVQNVVFSSIVEEATRVALAAEMLRVLRPEGWLLWYDAVWSGSRDPHFREVPLAEVLRLFPGLIWHWQGLTTHLGFLRRIHSVFGEGGMRAFDLLGLAKTHRLGWGRKP
jgi:SAM-dependent methyltransferase